MRYGYHLRGRTVALLTIATFVLMLGCLALPHLASDKAHTSNPPVDPAGGEP